MWLLATTCFAGMAIGFLLSIPTEYLARLLWVEMSELRQDNRCLASHAHAVESVRREELISRTLDKGAKRRNRTGAPLALGAVEESEQ